MIEIPSEGWFMVTRDGCPYCHGAREWFRTKKIPVQEAILNNMVERNAFYDQIKDVSHERTVPRIFRDGKLVGGFSDLQQQ